MRTVHVFVIWSCIRIKGEVSRKTGFSHATPPPLALQVVCLLIVSFEGGSSVEVL